VLNPQHGSRNQVILRFDTSTSQVAALIDAHFQPKRVVLVCVESKSVPVRGIRRAASTNCSHPHGIIHTYPARAAKAGHVLQFRAHTAGERQLKLMSARSIFDFFGFFVLAARVTSGERMPDRIFRSAFISTNGTRRHESLPMLSAGVPEAQRSALCRPRTC